MISKLNITYLKSLFSKEKVIADKVNEIIDGINGISDGDYTFTNVAITDTLTVDTINEYTSDTGVTVAGLRIIGGSLQPTINTVTQSTSIVTGVSLNTYYGTITTVSSTLAAGTGTSFILSNVAVRTNSMLLASIEYSGSSAVVIASIFATGDGLANIKIFNIGSVALDNVIKIRFQVIGGV